MKKLALLFLTLFLLLAVTGCGSDYDDYSYEDDYYDDYSYDYDDDYYDDSYYDDDYYDYGSTAPQGWHDVYACNLDQGYCNYVSVSISGSSVSSVTTGSSPEYPNESYCDDIGCAYSDFYGNQWYFDF